MKKKAQNKRQTRAASPKNTLKVSTALRAGSKWSNGQKTSLFSTTYKFGA